MQRLNGGILIGVDKDKEALEVSEKRLKEVEEKRKKIYADSYIPNTIILVHDDFFNILEILKRNGIDKVDGILLDLGVSSYQIDNRERGFSYMEDSRLDMRMNQDASFSAEDVINEYKEEELANIFFKYGEEKYSRKVAEKIVEKRKEKRIETTKQLVDIIESVIPFKKKGGNRSKKIFQAIRIEVNRRN